MALYRAPQCHRPAATVLRPSSPSTDVVISRYQAARGSRGLLDYDDLIDRSLCCSARTRGLGALQARPGRSTTC